MCLWYIRETLRRGKGAATKRNCGPCLKVTGERWVAERASWGHLMVYSSSHGTSTSVSTASTVSCTRDLAVYVDFSLGDSLSVLTKVGHATCRPFEFRDQDSELWVEKQPFWLLVREATIIRLCCYSHARPPSIEP